MFRSYQQLIDRSPYYVSEAKVLSSDFTERHMQALWFEQKYFQGLRTANGDDVEVLSPGIWNGEAGPDFLKAHLRIGHQLVEGDVELHLWEEGWRQHGHQGDLRYQNVVFHLVFWESDADATERVDGVPIPVAYLEPKLSIPLKRVLQLIDLDLYPYKRFLGSGKCSQQLFRRLSHESCSDLLHSAAVWRLKEKRQHLLAWGEDPAGAFFCGLAMALGYKRNTQAFLELACYLKDFPSHSSQDLLAVGMGCCGFFESRHAKRWEESPYYRDLRSLWWSHQSEVVHQAQLDLSNTRPLNHPVRRLVYLAEFLNDPKASQTLKHIEDCWSVLWAEADNSLRCRQTLRALCGLIPNYSHHFWNHHYSFNSTWKDSPVALLGDELRMTILINTVFPLLLPSIEKRGDQDELATFQRMYGLVRASASGKSRYLTHRFFGETDKSVLLKQADLQQGAYQIHRDFCIHYESSCEGCPFVERVKNSRFTH